VPSGGSGHTPGWQAARRGLWEGRRTSTPPEAGEGHDEGLAMSSWDLPRVGTSEPDLRLAAAQCAEAQHLRSAPSPAPRDAGSPASLLRACRISAGHAHSLQNWLSWPQARQDRADPGGRASCRYRELPAGGGDKELVRGQGCPQEPGVPTST